MATHPNLGTVAKHYLREWRLARGFNQAELAAKVDAKPQALSRWERGERGMTLEVMFALFEALDILPGQFFTPPGTVHLDWFALGKNAEKRQQLTKVLEAHTGETFPKVVARIGSKVAG
jgi:transcriptional regulator with XRE-family HTH domain